MTYDNTTRTYKVQHSRVVVDTYLVEAESEEDALDSWYEDCSQYPVVKTESMNDEAEVVWS